MDKEALENLCYGNRMYEITNLFANIWIVLGFANISNTGWTLNWGVGAYADVITSQCRMWAAGEYSVDNATSCYTWAPGYFIPSNFL